jgi:hypothetical protein
LCLAVLAVLFLVPAATRAEPLEAGLFCDEATGEPVPEGALLQYGQYTDGCRVSGPADLDTFTFQGNAGDVIRVRVRSTTPGLDPRLELRDPQGTVLTDTFCDGNPFPFDPVLCSRAIDRVLVLPGIYRVAMADAGVNESGGYILQIERLPPTVALPGIPYDSPAPVADVAVNPVTDTDFFTFDGVAGTNIRVIVRSITPGLDPRVEIRAPDGSVVADTFCNGNPFPFDPVLCSVRVDRTLGLTGAYLLIVSDTGGDEAGGYEITLNCLFGPCPTNPVNRPPVLATVGDKEASHNGLLSFTVTATDPDGDVLRFSAAPLPVGATFVDHLNGSATFSWTPDVGVPAVLPLLTIAVTDDGSPALGDAEVIAITVSDGNQAPQFDPVPTGGEGAAGSEISFTIAAVDPDGHAVRFPLPLLPPGANLVDNLDGTATFTWRPGADQLGLFAIDFTAVDQGFPPLAASATATVQVQQAESALSCGGGEPTPEGAVIQYGQHTDGCVVQSPADQDRFTFQGNAGDVIRVRVRSMTPGLDARVELRDPQGAVLTDTFCDGNPFPFDPVLCSRAFDRSLVLTGTYQIAVSDAGVDESGAYILQIERIPATFAPPEIPYDSTVPVRDAVGPPVTDTDFFVFEGIAGTMVRVILRSTTPGLDPTLEIRGPDGSIVANTVCDGNPFPFDPVLCSVSIDRALEVAGPYLVIVSDAGGDEAGGYELTLNCLFGPCPSTPAGPEIIFFDINDGAPSTTSRTVTLNNAAIGDPAEYQASEDATFADAPWLAYSAAPSFTLSAGFGQKTVHLRVRNAAGVISESRADSIALVPPPPAPRLTFFAINNGATTTLSRTVTLNNAATGDPTEYQASEDATFANAPWLAYSAAPSFTLGPEAGTKRVFLRVRNAAGVVSPSKSDSIALLGPAVTSLKIDDGAPSTTSSTVTLNNTATGDPIEYQASEDESFAGAPWLAYSAAPSFTLSPAAGTKRVYLRVRNAADVWSPAKSDTIKLEAPSADPPGLKSVKIDNGAASTTSLTVTLTHTLSGGAPTEYQASQSPTFAGAAWLDYEPAPTFTLSAQAGSKTVYFRVRNAAGTSPKKSDAIKLVGPAVKTLKINNGAASTASATVTLNHTVSGGTPTEYQASESPTFAGAAWRPYDAAPSFTLSAGAGSKTVYIRVRNAPGVESAVKKDTIRRE